MSIYETLMGIPVYAKHMQSDYGDYRPVSLLTTFHQERQYSLASSPGLFTPVSSISEARNVLVSPLHIAIRGVTFNAAHAISLVESFIRDEIDAITSFSPRDIITIAGQSVFFAIQIAVAVLQAVYDLLLSVLTIVTRLASTVMLGLMAIGSGLNVFSNLGSSDEGHDLAHGANPP